MPGSCFGRSSIHRVYSLGDLSVGRRSGGKPALTERSESGDCPDCAAAAGAEAPRAPAHSCGIQALPEHLLEAILAKLEGTHNRPAHHSVCGVCRSWRQLGRRLFFASPWSEARLICHPSQLFCLSPRPVARRSGLLRCFLQRELPEASGAGGGKTKYTLFMGRDHNQPSQARFLMCAVQSSRCEAKVYLNREGRGAPAGRLCGSLFGTSYSFGLAPGVRLVGHAVCQLGRRRVESAPASHGSLHYTAKVKGFMQPRKLEVRLPPPEQLSFGPLLLPQLCRQGGDLEASFHGGAAGSFFNPPSHHHGGGHFSRKKPGRFSSDSAEGSGCAEAALRVGQDWGVAPALPAAPPPPPVAAAPAVVGIGVVGWAVAQHNHHGGAQQAQQAAAQQEQGQPAPAAAAGTLGAPGEEAWRGQELVLRNKAPHWNQDLRCWCLNFRGRVKQASVKNFQLVRAGDAAERVVIQFGKVQQNVYILDWDPTVVTAFQAMAIALSTFGGKLML